MGSLPAHLSATQSAASSPPIHRAPNKFFDSLSLADRPRSRIGQTRNSSSATSLVGLARDFDSPSSGASTMEHVIELQFEDSHMALYAHYGYIVSHPCLRIAERA